MEQINIEGVIITKLACVKMDSGNIYHALKVTDNGFYGFGEAYFSTIKYKAVKAWKKHKEMVLNLVVPIGKIRFVFFDDRELSPTKNNFSEIVLSPDNYCRLTIQPGIWTGFQGMDEDLSWVLNIASIPHNPDEIERLDLDKIPYNWEIK